MHAACKAAYQHVKQIIDASAAAVHFKFACGILQDSGMCCWHALTASKELFT